MQTATTLDGIEYSGRFRVRPVRHYQRRATIALRPRIINDFVVTTRVPAKLRVPAASYSLARRNVAYQHPTTGLHKMPVVPKALNDATNFTEVSKQPKTSHILDLRKFDRSSGLIQTDSVVILSEKDVPGSTSANEKLVLGRPDEPRNGRLQRRSSMISVQAFIHKIYFGLAAIIFSGGAFVALQGLQANKAVINQAQALAATTQDDSSENDTETPATDVPDETKPDPAVYKKYLVAADLPRYLTIPKINVDAKVKRLGVKANNTLQTPSNIYDVGWYENSSKPGEPAGAVLLDGHVHGPTTPGVFFNLKKLVAGDEIQIERGDGSKLTYEVVKTQSYDKDTVDMAAALVSADSSKQGLNIITCAGKYNSKQNAYEDRLIVFAVQKYPTSSSML